MAVGPSRLDFAGADEHPQRAGYIFAFFCFMMFLQLVWVKLMVPETKGITLEEMQAKLGIELEPRNPNEPANRSH